MTDFRALCIELTDCLEKADWPLRYRYVFRQWVDIARAALADGPAVPEGREPASVVGDPSDEELIDFQNEWFQSGRTEIDVTEFQRATLARWGHQPAPPADGEVAELVEWLREQLHVCLQAPWTPGIKHFGRAAELLERLAAPVPVPTFRDAIQLAQGCHDYSGGYGGTPCAEAFHTGIGTVVNVLTKAASGPWDHQTKAVFAVGADLPLPAPQGGEVEL